MPASETTSPITRRRLAELTAAGGSALFLAACGVEADPNAGKSDSELLGYIRELQSSLADGYAGSNPAGVPKDLASAFADQSKAILAEIDRALDQLGSKSPPTDTFSSLDVATVPGYEPFLIGVVNAVVPNLGTQQLRQIAYKAGSASAGRLALIDSQAGKDPAPEAFVLGEIPPGFDAVAS